MDMGWLLFLLFVAGCISSYASFSDSPRKKVYRIVAITILLSFFILAKIGGI